MTYVVISRRNSWGRGKSIQEARRNLVEELGGEEFATEICRIYRSPEYIEIRDDGLVSGPELKRLWRRGEDGKLEEFRDFDALAACGLLHFEWVEVE